jgi:hypothetical protein
VPFGESRDYVRKITVSAILYAWVYDGRDPRETLHGLFPLLPWTDSRHPAVASE